MLNIVIVLIGLGVVAVPSGLLALALYKSDVEQQGSTTDKVDSQADD